MFPSMFQGSHTNMVSATPSLVAESMKWNRRIPLMNGNHLSRVELEALKECILCAYYKQDYKQVSNLCSQAFYNGLAENACIFVVRAWIEALAQDHEVMDLIRLGKHLFKYRSENPSFLPLSLLCFNYSGVVNYSKRILRYLNKKPKKKTSLEWECMCLALVDHATKSEVKSNSIDMLKKIAEKEESGFFRLLGYFRAAIAFGSPDLIQEASVLLSSRFPLFVESDLALATLLSHQGRSKESLCILLNAIQKFSENEKLILSLAETLRVNGELLVAADLLMSNSKLFARYDYDFNVTVGQVFASLEERFGSKIYREKAKKHLVRAFESGKRLGLDVLPISHLLNTVSLAIRGTGHKKMAGSQTGGRFWVRVLERQASLKAISSSKGYLLQVPEDARESGIVFFAVLRNLGGDLKLYLAGCAGMDDPLPDNSGGLGYASLSPLEVLNEMVEIPFTSERMSELWQERRQPNGGFGQGIFLELDLQDVETIDAMLEKTGQSSIYPFQRVG